VTAVVDRLLSVEVPPPVIPVKVYQDTDGQWKKEPLRKWDDASTDRDVLEGWWKQWPFALPAIPLKQVEWVAIDLDDYADEGFRDAWIKPERVVTRKGHSFVEPEAYSIYATPSGGRHIVFRQPDPPVTGRMQWSSGVEVLESGCLLTVHDVDAILYPRVAQRAILPEAFWRPWAERGNGEVGNARRLGGPNEKDGLRNTEGPGEGEELAGALEALRLMDPIDWRGKRKGGNSSYQDWCALIMGCKFVGIPQSAFLEWARRDGRYAADRRRNEGLWDGAPCVHGGAFFKALAQRGIKLRPSSSSAPAPSSVGGSPSVFHRVRPANAHPSNQRPEHRQTYNVIARSKRTCKVLEQTQGSWRREELFNSACVMAEMIAEKRLTIETANQLLRGALQTNGLWKENRELCETVIGRAYRHVELKLLGEAANIPRV
jgi:hypothetical protein